MYKRTKSVLASTNVSADRFIETKNQIPDIANSTLLYMLDKEKSREIYTITKYEYRMDLISLDIYGSVDYSWILMYINRVNLEDLVLGRELEYIPINNLTSIIRSI